MQEELSLVVNGSAGVQSAVPHLGLDVAGSASVLDAEGHLEFGAEGVRLGAGFAAASISGDLGSVGADSSSDIRFTGGATAGSGEASWGIYFSDEDGDGYTELNVGAGLAVAVGLQGSLTVESGVVDVVEQGVVDAVTWLFTW